MSNSLLSTTHNLHRGLGLLTLLAEKVPALGLTLILILRGLAACLDIHTNVLAHLTIGLIQTFHINTKQCHVQNIDTYLPLGTVSKIICVLFVENSTKGGRGVGRSTSLSQSF